jgi:hypothetical protein
MLIIHMILLCHLKCLELKPLLQHSNWKFMITTFFQLFVYNQSINHNKNAICIITILLWFSYLTNQSNVKMNWTEARTSWSALRKESSSEKLLDFFKSFPLCLRDPNSNKSYCESTYNCIYCEGSWKNIRIF